MPKVIHEIDVGRGKLRVVRSKVGRVDRYGQWSIERMKTDAMGNESWDPVTNRSSEFESVLIHMNRMVPVTDAERADADGPEGWRPNHGETYDSFNARRESAGDNCNGVCGCHGWALLPKEEQPLRDSVWSSPDEAWVVPQIKKKSRVRR